MVLRYKGTTNKIKIKNMLYVVIRTASSLRQGANRLTIRSESFINDIFGHKLILSKEIIQIV